MFSGVSLLATAGVSGKSPSVGWISGVMVAWGWVAAAVLVVVCVVVLRGGESSGAPTGMSHLWNGSPCGGLRVGLVVLLADVVLAICCVGVWPTLEAVLCESGFNGAPTGISHLCQGCP